MWDFLQYTSGERAFNFSQGTSKTARAEARARVGAGVQASRIVLKILCKSSSKYLKRFVAATGAITMGDFVLKGPTGCFDNLPPISRGEKKSG